MQQSAQFWARALVQVRVARLLAYRSVHAQATGELPDVLASAARIAVTQCDQAVAEVLAQALEDEALEAGTSAPLHGAVEDHWRYAQAATVASGSTTGSRPALPELPRKMSPNLGAITARKP